MKKIYSKIDEISGNVITVRAQGVRYGELALVNSAYGASLAEVIKIYEDRVSLQVFAGSRGISTGDRVTFLHHPMQVSFSDNLLGMGFHLSVHQLYFGLTLKLGVGMFNADDRC